MTSPAHSPVESRWAPTSLREIVGDLASGRTSPAGLLDRSLARIAETEPGLRAWVVQDPAPGNPGSTGPLGGVPLGVKDIIDVAGLPTRCGSALRAGAAPATTDATIVTAWRRAGAVPIGKTVTTEFAFFAPGPTQNPAAPGHTPGGSSSGSAAAVASGQVPLALGSQTAGSATRPASYCGVAALVLSHGRLPAAGVTGLSPSLDSHAVFAAGVTDLALAWSALTGEPDAGLGTKPVPGLGAGAGPARPPRVLLWSATSLGVVEPAMQAALVGLRARLAAAGASVEDFPEEELIADVTAAHPIVMRYEAARERAAELAVAGELSEPLANLLRSGAATSDRDHAAARQTIAAAGERVRELLTDHDVVIGPAAPGAAPPGLGATGDPILSRAWQALGLPVVTVPGLRDGAGLPLGVQVIGRYRAETELLGIGCWIEDRLTA